MTQEATARHQKHPGVGQLRDCLYSKLLAAERCVPCKPAIPRKCPENRWRGWSVLVLGFDFREEAAPKGQNTDPMTSHGLPRGPTELVNSGYGFVVGRRGFRASSSFTTATPGLLGTFTWSLRMVSLSPMPSVFD